jgi:hypothetical protein
MDKYVVTFFDDPRSPRRKEIGHYFASSLNEAVTVAEDRILRYRATHTAAGFRVQDPVGRTVHVDS